MEKEEKIALEKQANQQRANVVLQRVLFVAALALGIYLLHHWHDPKGSWQSHANGQQHSNGHPLLDGQLPLGPWADNIGRIWAASSKTWYIAPWPHLLPIRVMPLMRPGQDLILLPGGHEPTRQAADFYVQLMGLSPDQVVFTSGRKAHLDLDIDEGVLQQVRDYVGRHPEERYVLLPYALTPEFLHWARPLASELGLKFFLEDPTWMRRFGSKAMMHRAMSNLTRLSPLETIASHIPVPKGYSCETKAELMAAYQLLGSKQAVLKPVGNGAGVGIIFVHEEQQLATYDYPHGPVVLEEVLQLDPAPDGENLAPAVHYMGSKLLEPLQVDQIMEGVGWSGWRSSVASADFWQQALSYSKDLLVGMQPQAAGGFDFVSSGGRVMLLDVNSGRLNGAHYWKMFKAQHAPQAASATWNEVPPGGTSIWQFWKCLKRQGLAFTPGSSTKGVFPLQYLPGSTGQFIALCDTEEGAWAHKPRVKTCMASPE